ncbi:hypothetical protein Q604_UNBC14816G0001, partial [human gut metagenome]
MMTTVATGAFTPKRAVLVAGHLAHGVDRGGDLLPGRGNLDPGLSQEVLA